MNESLQPYGREISVREGRAFYYQDDPCEAALLLLEGSVRPVKFASDGKPFDLPPIGAGRWLGLAETLIGGTCLFDAVAAGQCRALSVSRANLLLAMREPKLSLLIAEALAAELVWTHRILSDDDSMGKLLSFLLARRRSETGGMERSRLMTTQNAVAETLGLTRETVNRQLKMLETLGLVTTGRGEIGLLDWEALAEFSASRER